MTRDEIYEHLAKVYLGKRENVSAKPSSKVKDRAWRVVNIVITSVLVVSTVYGFTAFLTGKNGLQQRVFYSLNNNPVRISYDLNEPFPATKTFSISIPDKDASKFSRLNVAIRGLNGAYPGVVKMMLTNEKNEKATYYIQNVENEWKKVTVPFEKLNLTDWTSVSDVSFILEAWNVDHKKGTVLVDEISFSN